MKLNVKLDVCEWVVFGCSCLGKCFSFMLTLAFLVALDGVHCAFMLRQRRLLMMIWLAYFICNFFLLNEPLNCCFVFPSSVVYFLIKDYSSRSLCKT